MTDDDRQVNDGRDGAEDGAAQAFDALRQTIREQNTHVTAEMTVIRKGVEAAFERFDTLQQPVDYSEDMGLVVHNLAVVAERLEAVETSPLLKNGPEHYARVIERSGTDLVKTAAQQCEQESRNLKRVASELAGRIDSARERQTQNRMIWGGVAAGLFAGVLLTLLAPRFLPFAADTHVAATVMGDNRWNAGLSMMKAYSQTRLSELVHADVLMQDNLEAVSECYQKMKETGKAQKCTVTVKVP